MPSYCTGISQPANGTMRAPAATWRSCSGVRRTVWAATAKGAQRYQRLWPSHEPVGRADDLRLTRHLEAEAAVEDDVLRLVGFEVGHRVSSGHDRAELLHQAAADALVLQVGVDRDRAEVPVRLCRVARGPGVAPARGTDHRARAEADHHGREASGGRARRDAGARACQPADADDRLAVACDERRLAHRLQQRAEHPLELADAPLGLRSEHRHVDRVVAHSAREDPGRLASLLAAQRADIECRAQSFRNEGMSISSSGISSDERWRSSMTGVRRVWLRPREGSASNSGTSTGRPPRRSKPVAITVTRSSSSRSSSITEPKMMFASPAAALWMISAASLTSNSPRSPPPVMFSRMPCAPSTDCSSSGLEIAAFAASAARFSPLAAPIPIRADPASCMIVRTSAKSRLMRPGIVIRSVMPWTP